MKFWLFWLLVSPWLLSSLCSPANSSTLGEGVTEVTHELVAVDSGGWAATWPDCGPVLSADPVEAPPLLVPSEADVSGEPDDSSHTPGSGEVPVDVAGGQASRVDDIRRGEATWYHPYLAGERTRSGRVYWPSDATIAAVSGLAGEPVVPLGAVIEVCHEESDTCLVMSVLDTGRMGVNDIDMSEEGFRRLAPTSRGRIPILWRVIDK